MYRNYQKNIFIRILSTQKPFARAVIAGSPAYPNLHGEVKFYQTPAGLLLAAEVTGLPADSGPCGGKVFGFHIHAGGSCSGTPEDPFQDAGSHYNPGDCPHPQHAGDLPPLFSSSGYAWTAFLTQRLTPDEVLGHTVIIHDRPDDFTSQPAGNAGTKIACGEIVRA